ncbi:hypothetical protein HYQ45_010290 [Verticillium longisporum]|uniref:Uncharacterized protein n=1 Tax=Verticillium longisporum TaxID=100787 RepID=A0A8I3ARC2_VERLO|nr:hypothetical protein HYQ45_010290 [Verticillium longisporum]
MTIVQIYVPSVVWHDPHVHVCCSLFADPDSAGCSELDSAVCSELSFSFSLAMLCRRETWPTAIATA